RDFHVTGVQTCALPIYIFTGKNRHGSGRALNGLCLSGGGDHHAGQFQLSTLRERRIGLGLAGNRAEQQRKGRNFLHEFLKSEIRKLLRRAGAEKPRALLTVPPSATPVMRRSEPVSGLMTLSDSPFQVLPIGR